MKKIILLLVFFISSLITYSQESNETVTDIDGNVYNTVKIGTQIWMAEDLKVTHYNVGTPIFNHTDDMVWANTNSGAYCWYYNEISMKANYGALYNWDAVKDGRLAPKGWHVPTEMEWQTLIDFLGGKKEAGAKLKEAGTSHWRSPNNGNNSSGFTALPSGNRADYGTFKGIDIWNSWWTSTSKNFLYSWTFYVVEKSAGKETLIIHSGCSVRCIKD